MIPNVYTVLGFAFIILSSFKSLNYVFSILGLLINVIIIDDDNNSSNKHSTPHHEIAVCQALVCCIL